MFNLERAYTWIRNTLMIFVTLETIHTISEKEPMVLGYKHDASKQNIFPFDETDYTCFFSTPPGDFEFLFQPCHTIMEKSLTREKHIWVL